MTANAIREKLYDYIRVADDKKIKAIYMMLEDDITEEVEWWKNNAFVDELSKRYDSWKKGETKAYSVAETKAMIEELRKKRRNK